ncbi:ABC transporter ATP-binding protein [Amycolatopsis nivea]
MAETGTRPEPAVVARGLVKRYGKITAVDHVDLAVAPGEVFALLGPNGAGKTTVVEILEGYRSRDAGEVAVLGLDPARRRARLKPRIGIVLQSAGADRYLTVRETLAMYRDCYPRPRPVDEVLELTGLLADRRRRVSRLSGGQQRRLEVAIALVGDPELLFLDEPTTGFDPAARHDAWQVIKNLAALRKTVLLTTHYLDEAQALAGRVAVLVGGRIVASGDPATLGGRDTVRPHLRFRAPDQPLPPLETVSRTETDGFVDLVPEDLTAALHRLTGWAIEHRTALDDLAIRRPTLEDAYLRLVGDAGRAAGPGSR